MKSEIPEQFVTNINSSWIFVSSSPHEARHLFDIIWYIDCLLSKGVPLNKIFVYQNNPDYKIHTDSFNISERFFNLDDFKLHIDEINTTDFCFITFTGHGSPLGVPNLRNHLSPTFFLEYIKKLTKIRYAYLLLGQCYAGIFDSLNMLISPQIGALGATKLNTSISVSTIIMGEINLKDNLRQPVMPWQTNLFLFHIFNWIRNPIDIDGDGKKTLLDAYKYAGSITNQMLEKLRFEGSLDIDGKLKDSKIFIRNHIKTGKSQEDLEFTSHLERAKQLSTYLTINQEPWLIYAGLVRVTVIF